MDLNKYFKAKKLGKSERIRKSLIPTKNGRSADFIAPGFTTGCEMVCTYCYVARHRKFGNPVEQYTNIDSILRMTKDHAEQQGSKQANQCDPKYWTYDIACNTDMMSPVNIDITNHAVKYFQDQITNSKPTFATKVANAKKLDSLSILRKARIRYSFMPEHMRKILEPATSSVKARIKDIQVAFSKGYEVHLNFSPVVVFDGWQESYVELMQQIDSSLPQDIKDQLKCEVIFLTHSDRLHRSNSFWHPDAEKLLWRPDIQEDKVNQRGGSAVRYKYKLKRNFTSQFRSLLKTHMPYCNIRYMF